MSLVAKYLFDDAPASTTVVDSVGGFDGTAGDAIFNGCSIEFSGDPGSEFATPTDAALAPTAEGTLSAWVRLSTGDGVSIRDQGEYGWVLMSGGEPAGEIQYRVGGTVVHTGLGLSILDGRLRHVAMSWNSSGSALYVNGIRIYTGPAPGPAPILLPWAAGKNGQYAEWWTGRLADFRLFNHKLSDAEVAAIAAEGSPCDDPLPTDALAWDVYAADDLKGPILATLSNAKDRMLRIEEDGAGVGGFVINRHSPEVTEAVLAKGNLVRVRIPEISDGYIGAFFLERGDFEVLSGDEEGGEDLQFGGTGSFSYLRRARMDAAAYSTGLDISDTWTEIWKTSKVTNPVGACLVNNDPTYLYVISGTTRKIYKIRQSDRAIVGSTPALWSGSTNYAGGLCSDPSNPAILWALESPWAFGGGGNTKIRKIDISGAMSGWNVATTFDLGSATKLTDVECSSGNLWTTKYDGPDLQKRSKTTGAVVTSYSISYGGVAQTLAVGSSINGSQIALWFAGKKRALIADLSDPTTITDKISTTGISAFGGAWTTEGGQDYFYPVSYTSDVTWKYQITTATPHDPVDGEWRLDEGTPGAILARIVAEIVHPSRPQHPVPDLTTSFGFTTDTDGNAWDSHPGTAEFTARIGDFVDETVLRLVPFGLTVQMDPTTLELLAYNADDFGVDRTAGAFGSGKVRLVGGVNAAESLRRRMDDRTVDTHMLVLGDDGHYARSVLADLGYVREGFLSTNLTDAGALEGTGDAELARERRDGDSQAAVVPWGGDPLHGIYLPGPVGTNGHYWVGDTIRVATGTDPFDLAEVDRDVKAITISELEQGTWSAVVDLASIFRPIFDPLAPPSKNGTGIGGTSGAGSSSTTVSASVIVKDKTNGESYSGKTIESEDWGVSQPAAGRVEVTIRRRKLGELADVEVDAIADGQGIAWIASSETWGPVDLASAGGSAATVIVADVSNPPTESELETAIDFPANVAGEIFDLRDSSSSRRYAVFSDGAAFAVAPVTSSLGSTAGSISVVTSAPEGGHTQVVYPFVEHPSNSDYLYFSDVNGTSGAVKVASYRKSTGATAGTFTLRTFTADTHAVAAILIRSSDHKMIVAYSDHSGAQLYVRISTNSVDSDPTLSGGFSAEQTLDAAVGGTAYTYPILVELSDGIYLFFRDEQNAFADGVLCYTKSTAGAAGTWSAKVEVWKISNKLCYWTVRGSGTRFDVAITDGSPPAAQTPVALYHFFRESGSYYKTDGSLISTALPLAPVDAMLVDSGATGDIWPSDVALTSDGRPVIAAARKTGSSDNDWVYAIWTGSAWSVHTVTNSNGVIEGAFAGGFALDHEGPSRILYSRKSGAHWELSEGITLDEGVSWSTTAKTSGSSTDYIQPRPILGHTSGPWAAALVGSYTTYLVNSLGIVLIGSSSTQGVVNLSRAITMRGTKAAAIALTASIEEVVFAWATDTSELGIRTNGAFVWIGAAAASPVTTKGDLHGFSTVDARVPVGTDGYPLVASSGSSLGVAYAAISVVAAYPFHAEPLCDSAGPILTATGDVIMVTGVPN